MNDRDATMPDCTCPARLGCARHDSHITALDGACVQLLELADRNGAHIAVMAVGRDGRVVIRLLSDVGYTLRTIQADMVPGSALDRPSIAIKARR